MKEKMIIRKRVLCLVLCCFLLVGIFPASIFAVPTDAVDLDPSVAGVYGWRLLDKDGKLVGGIRYPVNGTASHEGNSMDLNPYLSGLTDSGWGQYETADVYIGDSDRPLTENADWDAVAEKIKNDYRLEIFLVNTHGTYDAATGTFPYAWVEYDIETVTPSYNPDYAAFKLDFEGSGGPAGPSGFHWDYASTSNGPCGANFVVSVTDIDREPDIDQSGVYGWRIRDDSGAVVGGVRYPNPAGWPDQMNLDAYFTDGNYIGNRWTDGNNYETAKVHLGSAGMLLDSQENADKYIQKIVDTYTLEVFFVQADAASYKNGKYPCKWVSYKIKGATYTLDDTQITQSFTLDFDGVQDLYWDYSELDGRGPDNKFKASFTVTATESDRAPSVSDSGVYGWRIRDNATGEVMGGVRYPNPAGWPDQMNLDAYFTDGNYIGNRWTDGNPYEYAQIMLGDIIGMTLENGDDYAAFVKKFKENYTLEIFFVEVNGKYKGGKFPCAWVACGIENIQFDTVPQNGQTPTTHTLTLQVEGDSAGPDGLYWDYSEEYGPGRENGTNRYKASFVVVATEPMKMSIGTVTAWGVTNDDDFTAMTTNHDTWVRDFGKELTDLYKEPLTWPAFCNNGELEAFIEALMTDYQLRVSYRSYGPQQDNLVDIAIKKVTQLRKVTDEANNTFVLLALTPATAHTFGWHWSGVDPDDINHWYDTTSAEEMPLEQYIIRVQLVDPVDDKVAEEHKVTKRVVNPPRTTVNFFDYWLEDNGQFTNDFEAYLPGSEQSIVNKGINKGHLFTFMGSFAFPRANGGYNPANLGRWNVWTGDSLFAPYPDGNVPENNDGYGSGAGFRGNQDPNGILKPHSGIVARKLGADGYPQLALGSYAWLTGNYGNQFPTGGQFGDFYQGALGNANESLAYLFSPESGDYKEAVENVTGLFQLDNQGYYFFDSQLNFAELNKDTKHVTLYDLPWRLSASVDMDNDTTEAKGQFFPFNKWNTLFSVTAGKTAAGKTAVAQNHYNFRSQNAAMPSAPINHYFGMTVETEFQQPINGTITQGRMGGDKDIPMEFYFSGDDDVWIFIDDVLVGDIGGIHNPVSININFATGVIEYTAIDAPDGMNTEPYYTTTLKAMYDAANESDDSMWVEVEYTDADGKTQTGYIYPNGSIHTLKFYYLERGNDVSNCSIRFNTLPVVKDSIRKVDDNGNINYDACFDLYKASANKTIDANKWYNVADFTKGELIAENLVINNDPENPDLYTIMYEDGKAVDFTKFVTDFSKPEYFILDEKTVPDGFRGTPGIVIEFHPGTYTFTVKNKYETGAYASFSAEWKQIIDELYSANFVDGQLTVNQNQLVSDVQKGLTVVVPLMKIGGKWQPLFGSNTKGWHTVSTTGSLNKDLAQAALLQIAGTRSMGYQKWVMDLTDTGNLFGSMANLPGDATRYVINHLEDDISAADLTLVALFIPHDTLTDKLGVEGSTNSELYNALFDMLNGREDVSDLITKVSDKDFTLLYSNDFQRSYRTVIYAPNEQRELRVRKVDSDGNALNGAVFAIFDSAAKAAAFTLKGETVEQIMAELAAQAANKENSGLLSFGKTGTVTMEVSGEVQDGMLIFRGILPENAADGYAKMNWPKGRDAENTEFWLKEIMAPEGYKPNGNLVRIEVGNTTIYANATGYDGKGNILTGAAAAGDGITVQATLGKLAQTLVKYAGDNTVDVTLRDITVTKQTQAGADKLNHSNWYSTSESFDLHFGLPSAIFGSQYGRHAADAQSGAPVFEVTDGYVRAMPQQTENLPADADHTTAAKLESLSGINLDSLFGLPNTVVVANQPIPASIEISKTVEGEADDDDVYTFTINLTPAQDNTAWKDEKGWMQEITVYGYIHEAGHTVNGRPCTSVDHLNDCEALVLTYNGDGTYSCLIAGEKAHPLYLKNGQAYVILDLPEGTGYKITETIEVSASQKDYTAEDYVTDIVVTVGDKTEQSLSGAKDRTVSGTLSEVSSTVLVHYTNKIVKEQPTPSPATGDERSILFWGILAALSLVCFVTTFLSLDRKRRTGAR